MTARDFRIEARPYDDPEVIRLVATVQQEYVVRYGGEDEAVVEVEEFAVPHGRFFLGRLDGEAVATGGWRRRPERPGHVVEIKRMFVTAPARGLGLARLMLAELERTAAAAGADALVLNTGDRQPEAIALYRSSGYTPVAEFGHYAYVPGARFFGKSLR